MDSFIAGELALRYAPVAVLFAREKPPGCLQFKERRWGCAMMMLLAAAKGRTAAFDRKTFGCWGGGVGLGLRQSYEGFPGGFEQFLSTGSPEREGERYKKDVALARDLVANLKTFDVPAEVVVFKPLSQVDLARERPEVVVFFANPDQLSALFTLAHYGRKGDQNAFIAFGAGCQQMLLFAFHEARSETPRAVVGLTDLTARQFVDADLMGFAVPFALFQQLEADAPESFLSRHTWREAIKPRVPAPDPETGEVKYRTR